MSKQIEFKFNTPVTVSLAFADGRAVPSRFPGSVRTMRTTSDQQVFFCDPHLEREIQKLKPTAGMTLEITKIERAGKKNSYDWKVSRIGEQSDGTYKIPKADPSSPTDSEPAFFPSDSNRVAIDSPQNITALPARKEPTEAESHCYRLVDLTAATMKYAKERHGGLVREDDARSIAITVYIQAGRSGRLRWKPTARAHNVRRAG